MYIFETIDIVSVLYDDDEFFCGMVDHGMAFSLISSRDHCQGSSPSRISDMPQAVFEPAHNVSSSFS